MAGASGGGGPPGARSAMPRVTRVKNKQPAEQQVCVCVRESLCVCVGRVGGAAWRAGGVHAFRSDGASCNLPPPAAAAA